MNNEYDDQVLEKLSAACAENPRATTAQLAQAAGMSRATFNRIFGSRERLMELLADRAARVLEGIERIARADTGDYAAAISTLAQAHFENEEFLYFACAEQGNLDGSYWQEYLDALDSFFVAGQEAGAFRVDLPAATLTELFVSAVCGLIDGQNRGRIAPSGMAGVASSFFLQGAARR
jgi:TetR/AcrR family transcriptional repressor of mexCD-oprJ operon